VSVDVGATDFAANERSCVRNQQGKQVFEEKAGKDLELRGVGGGSIG